MIKKRKIKSDMG